MRTNVTRRLALLTTVAAPASAAWVPARAQTPAPASAEVERDGAGQTLQELYEAALKEGGALTVYAGGDEVTQGFGIKAGFEKQFPGVKVFGTMADSSRSASAAAALRRGGRSI